MSYTVLAGTTDAEQFTFEIRMIKRPADARDSLVKRYLAGLSTADCRKVFRRILAMAVTGPHSQPERYGDLGDGIYEIKVGQHRIPFFYAGRGIIVLTHGFFKRTQQAPPAEIRRARDLRELYHQQMGG